MLFLFQVSAELEEKSGEISQLKERVSDLEQRCDNNNKQQQLVPLCHVHFLLNWCAGSKSYLSPLITKALSDWLARSGLLSTKALSDWLARLGSLSTKALSDWLARLGPLIAKALSDWFARR